jgi:hypothetical protein
MRDRRLGEAMNQAIGRASSSFIAAACFFACGGGDRRGHQRRRRDHHRPGKHLDCRRRPDAVHRERHRQQHHFTPGGTVFNQPITVTFPVPSGRTTDSIYWT